MIEKRLTDSGKCIKKQMLTKEGISQVLYLGTIEGPKWEHEVLKEWESGRSVLDIKVYGRAVIPGKVKIEGIFLRYPFSSKSWSVLLYPLNKVLL